MSFRHETSARSPRRLALLSAYGVLVAAAALLLDMAPWIVALLLVAALPAAVDQITDRKAGLVLDDTHLRWHSGRQVGEAPLARIEALRFERRLDLTMRVRLVLHGGRRLALPQDCLPPPDVLRREMQARGLRCEDHPFSLL